MTDEATRTTFVRTRPALHEDEARCYTAESENFGLEANIPVAYILPVRLFFILLLLTTRTLISC